MQHPCDDLYANLIQSILKNGEEVTTRNSVCKRVIGPQCVFTRAPLVCARKTAWKTALREWEFFMAGRTNVGDMHESVRPWWIKFANPDGELPYSYGEQFRNSTRRVHPYDPRVSEGFDQIAYLIESVRDHPYSRRAEITTWNTGEMAAAGSAGYLTNCHGTSIQAFVRLDNTLDFKTSQRSSDVIVGLGANWLQYWAFLMWIAHRTGRKPGRLIWDGGDVHIYQTHFDIAAKVVDAAGSSQLWLSPDPNLVYTPTSEEFLADDFSLDAEYKPVLLDKAEMVV